MTLRAVHLYQPRLRASRTATQYWLWANTQSITDDDNSLGSGYNDIIISRGFYFLVRNHTLALRVSELICSLNVLPVSVLPRYPAFGYKTIQPMEKFGHISMGHDRGQICFQYAVTVISMPRNMITIPNWLSKCSSLIESDISREVQVSSRRRCTAGVGYQKILASSDRGLFIE